MTDDMFFFDELAPEMPQGSRDEGSVDMQQKSTLADQGTTVSILDLRQIRLMAQCNCEIDSEDRQSARVERIERRPGRGS